MRELPDQDGVRSSGTSGATGPTVDEASLVAAVRRGDPEAFDVVVRRHGPRLFRLARHLTGRDDEAEDLVQDTLTRALPALSRFEGRAALSTYLIRALTNRWRNRRRAASRSKVVPWPTRSVDDDAPVDYADPAPSAEERLDRADRDDRLRAALERLEPLRRLTLLLREVEGLSYEEIAKATAVPVGTVRSRLARARADMRDLLGGRP